MVINYYLTKERANLSDKNAVSAKLCMPEVDFYSVDATTGEYVNYRMDNSVLYRALEDAACTERALVGDDCGKDFYVEYALVRIKSLFREFPEMKDSTFKADIDDPFVRTAALIITAVTGVLGNICEGMTFTCRLKNPRRDVAKLFYEIDRKRNSINETDVIFYRAVFAFLGGTETL